MCCHIPLSSEKNVVCRNTHLKCRAITDDTFSLGRQSFHIMQIKKGIPPSQHHLLTALQLIGAVLISISIGLEPAESLRPILWMIDHISPIICCYLRGFYTGTNLYYLVNEAHVCEQLAHSRCLVAAWLGFEPATY